MKGDKRYLVHLNSNLHIDLFVLMQTSSQDCIKRAEGFDMIDSNFCR
jgi:hypothetical protein